MTPKASSRAAFVIALMLTGSGASEAQTNWPAGRTRPVASKSAKVRKAVPRAAIELLSKRLEMAEARLEALARPELEPPMLTALDDPQAPFRASLAIGWAELLSG